MCQAEDAAEFTHPTTHPTCAALLGVVGHAEDVGVRRQLVLIKGRLQLAKKAADGHLALAAHDALVSKDDEAVPAGGVPSWEGELEWWKSP